MFESSLRHHNTSVYRLFLSPINDANSIHCVAEGFTDAPQAYGLPQLVNTFFIHIINVATIHAFVVWVFPLQRRDIVSS